MTIRHAANYDPTRADLVLSHISPSLFSKQFTSQAFRLFSALRRYTIFWYHVTGPHANSFIISTAVPLNSFLHDERMLINLDYNGKRAVLKNNLMHINFVNITLPLCFNSGWKQWLSMSDVLYVPWPGHEAKRKQGCIKQYMKRPNV
jgi:hypothetical protein